MLAGEKVESFVAVHNAILQLLKVTTWPYCSLSHTVTINARMGAYTWCLRMPAAHSPNINRP